MCYLFSTFIAEFTCEAIWSWTFVCWKIFDYSFNFCDWDWSVQIFCFFLVQFWKLYFSNNLSISSKLSILWHIIAHSSLLWSFIFLCFLLWFLHFHFKFYWFDFPLFFLIFQANVLSILFTFSKSNFWFCWCFLLSPSFPFNLFCFWFLWFLSFY